MKKIIILIPVYNDWKSVFKLLENIDLQIVKWDAEVSIYIINEREQAVVTQFGKPVGEAITEAGLHFKTPLIQRVIKFDKTMINLTGLTTKTTTEPKIQETSTFRIVNCLLKNSIYIHNCDDSEKFYKDIKIEINKRFGMPLFIPLIALIT